jgi:apolipoprotein N-acyltransferase
MARPDLKAVATSLAAGVLLAASLPPWGFWPLAFAGIVLLDRVIADQPAGARFRRGWLVGFALLGPSMSWIKELTFPGYLVAVAYYAALLGVLLIAVPPGRGRRLALPAAWLIFEAFRSDWPFGGVPLSVLSVGQVAGPLAPVARLGGSNLLGATTIALGVGISALVMRHWRPAAVALGAVAVVLVGAAIAPSGQDTGRTVKVAYVQGGGPQGTRAVDTDPRDVFDRHLEASEQVPEGTDFVLWPEDVVDLTLPLEESGELSELTDLAKSLDTTLIVGVIEDEGVDRFHNSSIVIDPGGRILGRYEKVHRVPFGEYVPLRSLLEPLSGGSLPVRDAVTSDDVNALDVPGGRAGVVISWEVFFGHRARSAVNAGGEVVLNPTNGSSYTGTLVQSQQIASSRLRAIETGRWVVQAAPTGFSAFVTPDGEVLNRSGVSEARVESETITLRDGKTLYVRWGELPTLLAGVIALIGAWLLARRTKPVVDTVEEDETPPPLDRAVNEGKGLPAHGH